MSDPVIEELSRSHAEALYDPWPAQNVAVGSAELAAWNQAKETLAILQETPCPADVVFAVEYCGHLQEAIAHERATHRAYLREQGR